MKRKAEHILDFRGTITPISLLKALQVLREMETGETMEILGCHPDTLPDLLRVLPASSCELMTMEGDDAGQTLYRIKLKKKRDSWP